MAAYRNIGRSRDGNLDAKRRPGDLKEDGINRTVTQLVHLGDLGVSG